MSVNTTNSIILTGMQDNNSIKVVIWAMDMKLTELKVLVPEHVMTSEVGGELVILDLNGEKYFGLDEMGTAMWLTLTTSSTAQEAFDQLIAEYDVEPAQLEDDLRALIEKLVDSGLLEVHDA